MKRQTLQKTIIIETLKKIGGHPTPAMVYGELHLKYPTISQATVFRVLAGEYRDGKIQRVYTPGAPSRYEYNTAPHWHIRCRKCGKIADVHLDLPENLSELIKCDDGFTAEKCLVEFIGLCPECRMQDAEADEDK